VASAPTDHHAMAVRLPPVASDTSCQVASGLHVPRGIIQGGPNSIRQFLIINNQSIRQHRWQLPSIDNKRCFPIFPCVVGLIGY
jgi:hypothetical protein